MIPYALHLSKSDTLVCDCNNGIRKNLCPCKSGNGKNRKYGVKTTNNQKANYKAMVRKVRNYGKNLNNFI